MISRKKVDSQRERRVLTAMVTSKRFLAKAAEVLDLDFLDVAHFRQIAEWCVDYWKEYKDAPNRHIEDLYHKWSEDNDNKDLVESVHDFLEALAGEYDSKEEPNVPFLLDELKSFLRKKKLRKLQRDVEYAIVHGNVDEAEEQVKGYKSVEVGEDAAFDPLRDAGVWADAFAQPHETLIDFGGATGRFFNGALTRDALVGIQAPEKTGKTWWCTEFVFQGLKRRRKVAFFQVGDLSKNQILMRLGVRWGRRPMWENQTGKILVPVRCVVDEAEDAGYRIEPKAEKVTEAVSEAAVHRGRKKFMRDVGMRKDRTYLKVSVHPNSTINVAGISKILDQWLHEENFVPDIIVIDYADILAPETSLRRHEQDRNVVNDTWKALRRLSQERHALVIAPTQANALAYSQEPTLQTMKNFSEDKRKLAHVTAMLALNQTPEEKEVGGMRLNWIVLREAPYNIQRPLYVGTCFALGRALCCATM